MNKLKGGGRTGCQRRVVEAGGSGYWFVNLSSGPVDVEDGDGFPGDVNHGG